MFTDISRSSNSQCTSQYLTLIGNHVSLLPTQEKHKDLGHKDKKRHVRSLRMKGLYLIYLCVLII